MNLGADMWKLNKCCFFYCNIGDTNFHNKPSGLTMEDLIEQWISPGVNPLLNNAGEWRYVAALCVFEKTSGVMNIYRDTHTQNNTELDVVAVIRVNDITANNQWDCLIWAVLFRSRKCNSFISNWMTLQLPIIHHCYTLNSVIHSWPLSDPAVILLFNPRQSVRCTILCFCLNLEAGKGKSNHFQHRGQIKITLGVEKRISICANV